MNRAAPTTLLLTLCGLAAGCRTTTGPIFPQLDPPIVWPPPPDRARIQYIGALHGEESLNVKPGGLTALGELITGPRPTVAFSRPSAVAVAGSRIYVADTGLAAVHLLDLARREYRALTGSDADRLQVPIDVEIMTDDTLVVIDRGRAALDLFDLDGTWRQTLRFDALPAPVAAAWDDTAECLWLLDAEKHACFSYPPSGPLSPAFGRRGPAPGQFNFPSGIASHPTLGLVIADAMNFRVQIIARDGTPRLTFGQKGNAAGDFARPRDAAVDSEGHIYVVDNQFENIQIFDRAARLLMAFGRGGSEPGEFSIPGGLAIDEQDRIWVADSYNRRVQVFQYLPEEAACAR